MDTTPPFNDDSRITAKTSPTAPIIHLAALWMFVALIIAEAIVGLASIETTYVALAWMLVAIAPLIAVRIGHHIDLNLGIPPVEINQPAISG